MVVSRVLVDIHVSTDISTDSGPILDYYSLLSRHNYQQSVDQVPTDSVDRHYLQYTWSTYVQGHGFELSGSIFVTFMSVWYYCQSPFPHGCTKIKLFCSQGLFLKICKISDFWIFNMTTGWLLNRMAKGLLMTGEQELKDKYYENYIMKKEQCL